MDTVKELDQNDALVRVHLRNYFYRQKFHFVLGAYGLSWLANIILIGIIVYLLHHPTPPLYFPADPLSRLLPAVPLTQANMSEEEVSQWVVEAVEAAYSYDFVNYRAQLQNAQKYFTDYSWQRYMKALGASNNFLALTDRKFIIKAKVVAKPTLRNEGILGGRLSWRFDMPVLVTYSMPPFTDKSQFANPLTIKVIVQRQDLLQSYKGLGILQLLATMVVN